MPPSLPPHLRRAVTHHLIPTPLPPQMARTLTRATNLSLPYTLQNPPTSRYIFNKPTHIRFNPSLNSSPGFGKWVGGGILNGGHLSVFRGCGERGYRKLVSKINLGFKNVGMFRRKKKKEKVRELELSVSILLEEGLPNDLDILSIAEMLRLNAPMAMKLALDRLKNMEHKTRDTSINDVGGFETIELSLLLCNDEFIRKLNKEWRGEDHATDVLSMSQHIPELELPVLMLGDIVISVETAARQAEEHGHNLLDEIRILLIHGLLHLLGFDHELSEQAEEEMEKEEETLLASLGWKGKGLIKSACEAENYSSIVKSSETDDRKKEGSLRFYKPKFKYVFCDMDGTLLNSKSLISSTNANAIREAMSRGVQVVIATGKARPGAINALMTVDLVGIHGVLSESSPGVFLQGLIVYGRQGLEIFRRNLDPNVCREAFLYSQEHRIPLVAFCGDRCLTLFDHPLVDSLHSVYHEPKAETMASVEDLLAAAQVQKLVFLDNPDGVATSLRPYWSEACGDDANVVQTVPDMLELVPHGTSKGNGVKLLLDHLGVSPNEIMAIGDGENDIEMLKLAGLGVALSNGAEKTKAVADVIGVSNDEDGVADAIYRHAF